MLLGRVTGTVWATRHDPTVDSLKFLVVRALKLDGRPTVITLAHGGRRRF